MKFTPAAHFFAEDPRRANSAQWDCCIWRDGPTGFGYQLTWLEETGEACLLEERRTVPPGYYVVGAVPSYDLLEAVLSELKAQSTVDDVRLCLSRLPAEPAEQQKLIARYRAREQAEADEVARRDAASLEVVELSTLPGTETELADRFSNCDWGMITKRAIAIFGSGVDLRDLAAIAAGAAGLPEPEALLAESLFADPITVAPGWPFTDGRHRVAAMRAQHVERCVVHTYAGWPDQD